MNTVLKVCLILLVVSLLLAVAPIGIFPFGALAGVVVPVVVGGALLLLGLLAGLAGILAGLLAILLVVLLATSPLWLPVVIIMGLVSLLRGRRAPAAQPHAPVSV